MGYRHVVLLALFAGCFPDRASVDPFAYAPRTSSSTWKPLKSSKDTPTVPEGSDPISLAEAVDIALRNNPSTKISWAQARVAAAQYGISQANDYPSLSGTYQWQRSRGLSGSGSTVSATVIPTKFFESTWGPQLQLSYTLIDFGQRSANAEAAKQALFQADYTHNRQLQTVIQQVSSDYYDYQYQKALLKAKEADLSTAQITYDAAKLELETGVSDLSDVLQAQTQLIQAQMQLITQKQNVINALAALQTDMGVPANRMVAFLDIPEIPPIEEMLQTADSLLIVALDKRADLLAAEAALKSQDANVAYNVRQFFPTITYDMTFGQTTYTKIGSDQYDFASTLSLNIPIFSGFSTLNALRSARAQREEAEAQMRQTQLLVIQDITTTHSNVKTTFENMKLSDEFLRVSQKEYDIALAKYKAGTGNILEVMSAQSSLADARAKQAQAANSWYTALVDLSYAAGTLDAPTPQEVQ